MTAIAGIVSLGSTEPRVSCDRMLRAQAIYGNGPPTCWADGAIAIGSTVFRTLPEDAYDRGPIEGPDGCVLIADVRLDNRDELSRTLGIAHDQALTLPDAAILSRALARWSEGALDRIVGDFAFAWWKPSTRVLLLARDYVGQRPLHYHQAGGAFAFASMPKGLHALADIARAPNADAVADFLALIPEGTGTSFYAGIEAVPPGHVVVFKGTGVAIRRYWRPDLEPLRLPRSSDYAEALRAHLDRAVAARLRGARSRVAAHLSGGLDSAGVAATAARLLAPSGGRVTAYTAVPRADYASTRPLFDEGPHAASVAAMYPNIDHVLMRAGAASPLDALARNAFLYERPYLNLCNGTWVDAISDDARARGLSVLLTGSVGNAAFSFGGMEQLAALFARGRWLQLAASAWALRRGGTKTRSIGAHMLGPFLPAPLWRALRGIGDLASYSALHPRIADDPRFRRRAKERGVDLSYRPRRDPLETRLSMLGRVDFGNYNKGMLGGWRLDVRDPTGDRRLVEFCLRVPPGEFLVGGVPRSLARRSLTDRLPPQVTGERRKGYQGADWHEGLTAARARLGDEIARIARDPHAAAVIDTDRLQAMLTGWPRNGWEDDAVFERYRLALLRGVSAGHFMADAAGTN